MEGEAAFAANGEVSALDLNFFHARWYDPEVGRFISPDPVNGGGVTSQTGNSYSYGLNSPRNYIDKRGDIAPIVVAAIIFVGAVVAGAVTHHLGWYGLDLPMSLVGLIPFPPVQLAVSGYFMGAETYDCVTGTERCDTITLALAGAMVVPSAIATTRLIGHFWPTPGGDRGPMIMQTPDGPRLVEIPTGARPRISDRGHGVVYEGGSGGGGSLHASVTGVRIMPRGSNAAYPHSDGYVRYYSGGTPVHPYTGVGPLSNADKWAHIDLMPDNLFNIPGFH